MALKGAYGSASASAFRGALVRKTLNQTLVTAVNTVLVFQAAEYDTDKIHDAVVNTSRLTVPAGVTKVRVAGALVWGADAMGDRTLELSKNGGGAGIGFRGSSFDEISAAGGTDSHSEISAVVDVVEGDFFELRAQQTSGGNLGANVSNFTWFSMEILE